MLDSMPTPRQRKQRVSTSAAKPGSLEYKPQSSQNHDRTRPITAKSNNNIPRQAQRDVNSEIHPQRQNETEAFHFASQEKGNRDRMDQRSRKTGSRTSRNIASGHRTRTGDLPDTDHKHTNRLSSASSHNQPTKSGRLDLHRCGTNFSS